jgi:hypothetical protein
MASTFLTWAPDVAEWLVSRQGRFTPAGVTVQDTHWIGGWVCPRVGLPAVGKRKKTLYCRELNLDRLLLTETPQSR